MGERVRTLLRIINWESLKSLKIGIIIILIQYQGLSPYQIVLSNN